MTSDPAVIAKETDGQQELTSEHFSSFVKLYKSFDDGNAVTSDFISEDALRSWIQGASTPYVQLFTQEASSTIFASDVQLHHLLFADPKAPGFEDLKAAFTIVAKKYRGKSLHICIPPDETGIIDYFGIGNEPFPNSVIVNMEGGLKQYRMRGATGPDGMRAKDYGTDMRQALMAFEDDYHEGLVPLYLKSQPAVYDERDAVKIVTGSDFEKRVMQSGKDVLLQFYAPWCGHCKALAPKYADLGKKLSAVSSIVIAKMDATANDIDHPEVDIQGFPTIKFFPARNPAKPMDFDDEREVKSFLKFLKANAGPFELDGQKHGKDEL